ncbi:peptidylprolyl isomerase [Rhodohalobacter sp. 8-1]|uniref:peptidylprolyl isomerase n=1 Tax=Rhodohalobacter sp. 8-1 TaxID=3131972 RepID=UPI0030EE9351
MNYIKRVTSSVLLSLILLSPLQLFAQSSQTVSQNMDAVVAEIGDESISLGDLISYYERNNIEDGYSSEELKEFLPFYVDYKLKLAYGKDQGLYSDPEIQQEFENYSKQAAFSFWLENEIKSELEKEFIERSEYELKSTHVLIRLDPNSSADDAEEARLRIEEARQRFIDGEMTMEELNREYSTQVQGRPAGGELPWFSAGVTVKPFEDALYSLEKGELSEPVRTQFGFHIIYLEDRRQRTPQRSASHIFFRGSRDDLSAEILADSAYATLEKGRPWDEVVQQFSQDGSSVNNGGSVGWVGYGTQYSADFIDAVLSVDPIASFSQPIQTNYGYHIFRIDSVRSYQNDEQRREELLSQLEELPRYNANRQQVLERISEIGNFSKNSSVQESITAFFSDADSSLITNIDLPEDIAEQTLISFNNQTYTSGDFKQWLHDTHSDRSTKEFSDHWVDLYEEYVLDSQIIPMTNDRFPEFKRETDGFLNGLVVFQVSDENIWNIETADSSNLEQYYERNKDKYRFDERHDYTLLASRNDSALTAALEMTRQAVSIDSISRTFDNLIITRDSVATPSDEILTALNATEIGETSDKFTYRNRDAYVIYHQLLEPRTMTFNEAFYRVGSDYQPIREENFMNELRSEYRVRIYPERIR